MSTTTTTLSLRATFEQTAAVLLYVAIAATVAGGAIAMCLQPFAA